MPTFIGLDLAWTTKNESGICWLEGDSRENLRCTRLETRRCETESLAEEVAAAEPAVVTIDAPLLYSDKRWVDSEIGRKHRFYRYKIAAHSAKAAVRRGYTAGIDLGEALQARRFTCDPPRLPDIELPERIALEVYPHTIHVRLFGLKERLKYKRGPVACKRQAMVQYQEHLQCLIEEKAPRLLDHSGIEHVLKMSTAMNAKGKSLKRLDDTLDGLTCALAAWLIWKEPERWEMIGDLNGYIVAPRDPTEQAMP